MRRVAGFAYSKHRSMFGLVVAEAGPGLLRVGAARQWDRSDMAAIAPAMAALHKTVKWGMTYADQMAGEHLLAAMGAAGVPISPFSYKKALDDPHDIERTVIMDRIEQVQFLLMVKQQNQLKLAGAAAGPAMAALRTQIATFGEHLSEAGAVDYYAPGEEHDHLIRALLAASFALRNVISGGEEGHVVVPIERPLPDDLEEILYE